MIFLPNLTSYVHNRKAHTASSFERPSYLEAQRVLGVMLPRPRRILRRVANARGGIRDGVAGAFGRVADGARHALSRITDGVAHTADCREVVSNLMWEGRERERKRERERGKVRMGRRDG